MGDWAVRLNDVYIGCGDPYCAEGDPTPVGFLNSPPEGLSPPPLRSENYVFPQRDGQVQGPEYYEARTVTFTATVCPDDCPTCPSVRHHVHEIVQAWKRQCDTSELVIYTDCHDSEVDDVVPVPPDPSMWTEERRNLGLNPRARQEEQNGRRLWFPYYKEDEEISPAFIPNDGPLPGMGYVRTNALLFGGGGSTQGFYFFATGWPALDWTTPGTSSDWLLRPLAPSTVHTVSVYARSQGPTAASNPAPAKIKYRFHDGAGTWLTSWAEGVAEETNAGWVRLAASFTTPAAPSVYLTLQIEWEARSWYVPDDFLHASGLLIEAVPPVRENLAYNPRAENVSPVNTFRGRYASDGTLSWETSGGPLPEVPTFRRRTFTSNVTGAWRGFDHYCYSNDATPGTTDHYIARPLSPSTTYTVSQYFRTSIAESALARIGYRLHDGAGNWLGSMTYGSTVETQGAGWVRASVTFTTPSSGPIYFASWAGWSNTQNWQNGDTYDASALLIEETSEVRPLIAGVTADDYFDGYTQSSPLQVGGDWWRTAWVDEIGGESVWQSQEVQYVRDGTVVGPYGLVGKPKSPIVSWHPSGCADITFRFDSDDPKLRILDECGTPGYSWCSNVTSAQGSRGGVLCFNGGDLCFTDGELCFAEDSGEEDAGEVEIQVIGSECVCPEIVLHGPLLNPVLQTESGQLLRYHGTIPENTTVTIDGEYGSAMSGNSNLSANVEGLKFCFSPGTEVVRLNDEWANGGWAEFCWRPSVIGA